MTTINHWWRAVLRITAELEHVPLRYCLIDDAALLAQGVALPTLPPITIFVQWDGMEAAHDHFASFAPGPIRYNNDQAQFGFNHAGCAIEIECKRNTVVAADPQRVAVEHAAHTVWARSILFYARHWPPADERVALIHEHLRRQQHALNAANAAAWNHNVYAATIERHGAPAELAARILAAPEAQLRAVRHFLGDVRGTTIANLLGSYGGKAVALAALGAQVTVVDIAPDNARYARELAAAAGVELRYIVADVLALPPAERAARYDLALMEQGILHYFIHLQPLAQVVADMLRPGGRLVLHEFHPISTKLITSKGRKHNVAGNYFSQALHETDVAYAKHLGGNGAARVRLRRWTLGETITAFAEAGLCVRELVEEPNTKMDDVGLPKTFTLVASKR